MLEEKLDIFEKRYNELNNRLYQPDVATNPEQYQKIMKEFKEIEPIVEEYRTYKQALQTVADAMEMLGDSSSDREMKELAEEELAQAKNTLEESQQKIKILLLPKDPNDDRNVIVEIRGGAGGEESAFKVHIPVSNLKAVCTEFSVYPKRKHRDAFTLQPPRWRFCPKRKMLNWKSILPIYRLTLSAAVVQAVSISTKQNPLSVSRTFPRVQW